ncbi:MAG: ATP-binding protein [Anaerolineales bacterium]
MTLALVASLIAFGSYGSLLMLLFRSGIGNRARQLFFLYLLVMLMIQGTYLMVSLAREEQSALFGYMINIPLSLGQAGVYFFFSRAFLEKKIPRALPLVSVLLWAAIVVVCLTFRTSLIPGIYRDPYTGLFVPQIGGLASVLSIPVLLVLGITIFELAGEYKKSPPLQKVRIQYLILAISIVWLGMLANSSSALRPYPIDVTANIISAVLIALAILRYQLLDINIVIRKGMVYSVSVLIMGVGYFIVVFLLTRLFVLDRSNTLFLSIIAAVIVVGILTPLRDRIQVQIDRALFREKYDGMAMIQRLSDTIASILELDRLANTILDDITESMHIQWAVLSHKQGKGFLPVAARGVETQYQCMLNEDHPVLLNRSNKRGVVTTNDIHEMLGQGRLPREQFDALTALNIQMIIPLQTRHRLVGVLILGPKLSQQVYSPDDELVLATLANHVAVAMDNARLYDALQLELTEREKLIVQLKSTNAELESFTYTVSHDLKAPLITINGFLNFLEKDALSGNAARIKADIVRISEATTKMHRLLTELLELSRIGRMMNEPETIPFADLLNDALSFVHGRLEAGRITVQTQPNLPIVRGDRRRLTEVLQNLLDNAAKYMGEQPNPCIEIGQRGERYGKPVFFIKDNGIGIAPEHHDRIFGLFNKLDPTSEGTGIGLALIKKIIEFHKGRIWLESEVGKGSTFFFTLPKE